MDCRALAPHQLPHTTNLIRDYIENFPRLQSFYAHKPDLPSAEAYARQLQFPADRRREVAAILREENISFGCSPETEKNLLRLENGAVAIVSGQQVGLFGGPAYAFYKALTVIEAARELSLSGIEAVPIFWMATGLPSVSATSSAMHAGIQCARMRRPIGASPSTRHSRSLSSVESIACAGGVGRFGLRRSGGRNMLRYLNISPYAHR